MQISTIADIKPGLSTSGRAAGSRRGDWELRIVESADIVEDCLQLSGLRKIMVVRSTRAEKHLLKPFDLLVTARSPAVKVALVPPGVTRTVASSTLLVLRTPDPGSGLAHFLWFYLSSTHGRAQIAARFTKTFLPALSAKALGELRIRLPGLIELQRLADLIDAAEISRITAIEAARIRHGVIRDAVIGAITAPAYERC